MATRQQSATWAEKWNLQWTPESEIALVEAVLLGETVELATAYKFKTHARSSARRSPRRPTMVRDACQCGLMKSMELARRRLQELAAVELRLHRRSPMRPGSSSLVVRYGDVRKFDPAPLLPLVEELFVQGALALLRGGQLRQRGGQGAAGGDRRAEQGRPGVSTTASTSRCGSSQLQKLADADDRNPLLSGYACAILLERGLMANEDLAREVSRRLSPGVPADLGAGWFEGLAKRNRYALLARQPLWEQLADYIASLDDEQFRRALVFLRRAFGGFSPHEKRQIAENLGEYWGVNADAASELIEQPLTETEEKTLKDLNEFDFDDL